MKEKIKHEQRQPQTEDREADKERQAAPSSLIYHSGDITSR